MQYFKSVQPSLLLFILLIPNLIAARQNKPGDLKLEPYVVKGFKGQRVNAELGHLFVPENRNNPQSRLIELSFLRFRSSSKNPGPPTIFLTGGPGVSAYYHARSNIGSTFYNALQEVGDLILLEQRGTFKSKPALQCDGEIDYPLDKPLELKELLLRYKEQCRSCKKHWQEQGVDLTGYNTIESADDIEALRKALGIEKLNLLGESYGTHLALATMRRYEKSIHRVILAGVEGPDHTYKLPGNTQKYLEDIAQTYKDDPKVSKLMPDLIGLIKALLDELEKQPVTVAVTHPGSRQRVKVTVGKLDLQFLLITLSVSVQRVSAFPEIAYAMSKGDFSPLAEYSLREREGKIGSAMSYMMDCASSVSPERLEKIKREEKSTLVGRLIDFPFPEICEEWGAHDLGAMFRSPIKSNVPTLFISGTLDGRTPVSNAEEIRQGFPNSTHLIVAGAGHDTLFIPKTVEVMLQFLKGVPVSTTRIESPPLKFKLPNKQGSK